MNAMRRPLAVLVLAVALPLTAQNGQPAQQVDSPLVAAAKRMNRKGKKPALVITNASLLRSGAASSGAHVTTTASQSVLKVPAPLPPLRPTPEMEAAAARAIREKQLAEQAALKKVEAEAAQRKMDRSAAAAEDIYYGGDREDADDSSEMPPPPPPF